MDDPFENQFLEFILQIKDQVPDLEKKDHGSKLENLLCIFYKIALKL
jgi:hypothetical protein